MSFERFLRKIYLLAGICLTEKVRKVSFTQRRLQCPHENGSWQWQYYSKRRALCWLFEPVHYHEKHSEREYDVFLVVLLAILRSRPHLKGSIFILRTNYLLMRSIFNQCDVIQSLHRWRLRVVKSFRRVVSWEKVKFQASKLLSIVPSNEDDTSLIEEKEDIMATLRI